MLDGNLTLHLFDNVKTVRISETFNEPEMATDLLETNLKKLNRLFKKAGTRSEK